MKQSKSLLACALFLLLGAASAFAAGPAEAPAELAASAVQAAAAAPAVSAANPADCAAVSPFAPNVVQTAGELYLCGSCSQSPCAGAAVNSVCGFANGKWKRCQDYLGTTCAADGNARCRCSSDPIP